MKALCAVLFTGLLVACAQIPRPSTYPYSLQQQMQAAEHWQALAVKMVENLPSGTEPVYLPEDDDSPFEQALRSFLETELTQRGIPLAPTASQGLTLTWDTQPIWHGGWRYKPHLPFPVFLLEPLAFLVSPGVATGGLPHYEVIVTTKIFRQDHRLWQDGSIFYVNDADWWHYMPSNAIKPVAVRPIPECDHARVRAQCPLYQYRTDVYRAKCQDGSGLEVSLGALTVFPPPADRARPWQAKQCTITAVAAVR
jgi:hypothetical protein